MHENIKDQRSCGRIAKNIGDDLTKLKSKTIMVHEQLRRRHSLKKFPHTKNSCKPIPMKRNLPELFQHRKSTFVLTHLANTRAAMMNTEKPHHVGDLNPCLRWRCPQKCEEVGQIKGRTGFDDVTRDDTSSCVGFALEREC